LTSAEEQPGNDEKLRKAIAKRMRQMQIENQKKELVRRFTTPEAYERLSNVRMANPELYSQLLDLIISMGQSGRITTKLTEDQLKSILAKLTFKPESKIEFKHK
jgi:programmed cell death protein 5